MSDTNGESRDPVGAAAVFGAFAPDNAAHAVAEKPEMRSVAVMSAPTLQLRPPSGGLRMAKPPPLGIARPPMLSRGRSDSLKVKHTWTGVTAPCAWDVEGEDLELVPMDFPLERTHRTIEGADAKEVSSRISEALRTHSIQAEYMKKPAKAKCKTNDFVSFRIRLYAGGDSGLPVVVEVQRRSGSVSSFMKSCRAILAAAEGSLGPESNPKQRVPPFMIKPVGGMQFFKSVPAPLAASALDSDEVMEKAVGMIRSDKKDANILGLENLLALTDPIKTSVSTAMVISKAIILGNDKHDVREDLRAITDRDLFVQETEDEEAVSEHSRRLRHLGLTIFANALFLCARDGCLEAALKQQAWFQEQLLPTLVDELKVCHTSAACSLQAARCMSSILESSAISESFLRASGVQRALQDALEFGTAQNDLLAEETSRCLKLLNV